MVSIQEPSTHLSLYSIWHQPCHPGSCPDHSLTSCHRLEPLAKEGLCSASCPALLCPPALTLPKAPSPPWTAGATQSLHHSLASQCWPPSWCQTPLSPNPKDLAASSGLFFALTTFVISRAGWAAAEQNRCPSPPSVPFPPRAEAVSLEPSLRGWTEPAVNVHPASAALLGTNH